MSSSWRVNVSEVIIGFDVRLVNEVHSLNPTHLSACFSGRIPTELGQLTALTKLTLYNNKLTGECD